MAGPVFLSRSDHPPVVALLAGMRDSRLPVAERPLTSTATEVDGFGRSRMRFLYFYLMKDSPDRVRAVAPDHSAYWRGLGLRGYLGGPFDDRSGGLITFEVGSAEEAERLVADDPFVQEDLLERRWVKGWIID